MREKYWAAEEMLEEKLNVVRKMWRYVFFIRTKYDNNKSTKKHKQMCPKYKSQINAFSFSRICFISWNFYQCRVKIVHKLPPYQEYIIFSILSLLKLTIMNSSFKPFHYMFLFFFLGMIKRFKWTNYNTGGLRAATSAFR